MASHRFIGDRSAPTQLASVRRRRMALGTVHIPAALRAMAGMHVLYSETETKKEPDVHVDSVEHTDRHLWRIEVPVSDELRGARPGLTMERHPSTKFLDEVNDAVSFTSHRPEWIDVLPVPQVRRPEQQWSRRFCGTRVRPLWVYDNARHAFDNSAWPLGLVGRIFNSQGFSGTGSLIGGRLVITAGH